MVIPHFSIVVPTLNKQVSVKKLIESIICHLPKNWPSELIIIANKESKELENFINEKNYILLEQEKLKLDIKYSFTGRLGANIARNKGVSLASHELIIFLDDDCLIDNEYFFHIIAQHFREDRHLDILGGRYRNSDTASAIDKFYNFYCNEWLGLPRIGTNHLQLLGGCLIIKKKIFKQHGSFEENIIYGASETELLDRFNNLGVRMLLDPALSVIHNPNIHLFKLLKKAYLQGKNTYSYRLGLNYPKRHLHFIAHGEKRSYLKIIYQFAFKIGHLYTRSLFPSKNRV